MAATKENPIIFYDLVDANGKSWSPNPYKTRLSLNYKGIPYRTDVSRPPISCIFAPGTAGFQHMLMSNYRMTVGAPIFPLIHPQVPRILDARSVEYMHRTRAARLVPLSEDEATEKWNDAHQRFTGLAQSLALNDETGSVGPFMMGDRVSFADFALAGVFYWIRNVEGSDSVRLKEMLEWDGGRWGKHWKAIQEIEHKSSEVI
ncbi:hypothetical protein B0J17DRAFT_626450 [Rhizoctonia solani]|nr:hypothetical protein B0J17DRAFT_626450 [Rhizoctonia solani]